MKLTKQKNIRVSGRESKAIAKAAREAGVSEPVWIRLIVRAALGETALLEQLSRAAACLARRQSAGVSPVPVSWAGHLERLTQQKNFRVSARESIVVEKAARKAGVSESVWFRVVVRVALGETALRGQRSRVVTKGALFKGR